MGGHHHHHDHGHGAAPIKVLTFAIVLTFAFAALEALVGWWSHSLVLLSDAGHMGSDALALTIAAFAAWLSQKPPSDKHSYGLGRAEVVAAWLSSLAILAISIFIIVEAIERIHMPHTVKSVPVMIVAFIGLIVNVVIAWMLARGQRTLNVRAALLHVMSDVLGSIAALIAGAVIFFIHWNLIDPILSIFIGVLITISSLRLLRESLLVLMEGVPKNIKIHEVSAAICKLPNVDNVHDLHIWTLSSGNIALSAHIDIKELSRWPDALLEIQKLLRENFHIEHITLQPEPDVMDCVGCK